MTKTCFMTGNRSAQADIYPELCRQVKRHIVEFGVGEFFIGANGNFDALARKSVNEVRREYPEVRLTLVMHYLNTDRYDYVIREFDGSIYPDGLEVTPLRFAISRANRIMVHYADYLIIHARDTSRSSGKLLRHALGREKRGLLKVTEIE